MSITINEAELTVTHEQLEPSPNEVYGEDNSFNATRILKCAWSARHDLARQLRGYFSGDWPNHIVHLPHRYPDQPAAFVRSISRITGKGKTSAGIVDSNVLNYSYAELAVNYGTSGQGEGQGQDGDDAPLAIITESLEPAAEFITLSGETLAWDNPGGPPVEAGDEPSILVPGLDWIYTIHQITNLPAAFISLTNFVNQYSVVSSSLNYTFPAETLLYHGPSPRRIITTEGAEAWEVTLRFTVRFGGWNMWWRSGSAQPEPQRIFTSTGEYRPFPVADFVGQLVL